MGKQTMVRMMIMVVALATYANAWSLSQNYSGSSFFDNFNFFTDDDPTHGYVNYISQQDAQNEGLISAEDGKVIISTDSSNVASGRGRDSVRITSNDNWGYGLFVLDLVNMPTGCGTWPAWWLVGPNWPNAGEIDIIEGVNTQSADQTTLHTSDGCSMDGEGSPFSGTWGTGSDGNPSTNCYVNAPNEYANQGCGIIGSDGSYGSGFNQQGGGAYALEWTSDYIRAFYFPRGSYPSDLTSESPVPDNWGTPYAYFTLGGECSADHFQNQSMVFDLTFCGDWAGATFGQMCPNNGDCNSFVQNNPSAFTQAYWNIVQVLIYQ